MLMVKAINFKESMVSKVKEEKGQGMVEYALLIGLIAVLLISGLVLMREQIAATFTKIVTALTT